MTHLFQVTVLSFNGVDVVRVVVRIDKDYAMIHDFVFGGREKLVHLRVHSSAIRANNRDFGVHVLLKDREK